MDIWGFRKHSVCSDWHRKLFTAVLSVWIKSYIPATFSCCVQEYIVVPMFFSILCLRQISQKSKSPRLDQSQHNGIRHWSEIFTVPQIYLSFSVKKKTTTFQKRCSALLFHMCLTPEWRYYVHRSSCKVCSGDYGGATELRCTRL